MRRFALLSCLSLLSFASAAQAGIIASENAKSGIGGSWTPGFDGSAFGTGDVDLYPAAWSISPGDALGLKVRAKATFDVRVMRLGHYGGAGATEVKLVTGNAANVQPYPTPDATSGLAEAKWTTNVTITDTAGWTPGFYVARAELAGGKQAVTFFVVRDDKLAAKLPYILIVGTNTHQAYNAWPGPAGTGATDATKPGWLGKSLYGFNSSSAHPSESITTLVQAVRVSYDRPFLVGGGSADTSNYEYPFLRWAEKNGYDLAYATDVDLHANPSLLSGRKLAIFSGHEEYTTGGMFDHALAARKAGVNMLFLSGDTWSWQVRFESGSGGAFSTMVGYKESWVHDPEQKLGYSLKVAGKIEEAKTHYAFVTRGWKNLEQDATAGIDMRRPGMILTGVSSAGVIRDAAGVPKSGSDYPWANLEVNVSPQNAWIFAGTGLKSHDIIPNVFGYEVDSTLSSDPTYDSFRPSKDQWIIGAIKQVSDGVTKGSSSWFRDPTSGAEVVAMGAIYTGWGLDDWAWSKSGTGGTNPTSEKYQQIMKNIMDRYAGGVAPVFDAGPVPDGGDPFDAGPVADADPIEKDVGAVPDVEGVDVSDVGAADTFIPDDTSTVTNAVNDGSIEGAGSGCTTKPGRGEGQAGVTALSILGLFAFFFGRRRPGGRTNRRSLS
ncbi:MAG: N,N-dimethylformamidase beta subunit family domain-containing protein [Polyangiales bacterium]